MSKRLFCILFLIVTVKSLAFSQIDELGSPKITNFSVDEYSGKQHRMSTQNWGFAQDTLGVIYVANSSGLLIFNGVNWQQLIMPNKTIVRSVICASDQKIYLGGNGIFGFIQTDSQGLYHFVSLAEKLPRNTPSFADVWSVNETTDQKIIFETNKTLFIWANNELSSLELPGESRSSFIANGTLYYSILGVGLCKFVDGKISPVKGGQMFAKHHISTGTALDNQHILLGSRSLGLYIFNGETITKWQVPVSLFANNNRIQSTIKLNHNKFALATAKGGVIIFDRKGNIRQILNTDNGLQDNIVYKLFLDKDELLWMALGNGISVVNLNEPFSFLTHNDGLPKKNYSLNFTGQHVYVANEVGVFIRDIQNFKNFEKQKFKLIPGTDGQSWQLLKLNSQMMGAHNPGIMRFNGKTFKQIGEINENVWLIVASPLDTTIAYAAMESGIAILKYKRNNWTFGGRLAGFSDKVKFMETNKKGEIWTSDDISGIRRIVLNAAGDSADVVYPYGVSNGLPENEQLRPTQINQRTYIIASDGLYYLQRSNVFAKDTALSKQLAIDENTSSIITDPFKRLWISSVTDLKMAIPKSDGNYKLYDKIFNVFAGENMERVHVFDSTHIFIVGDKKITHFDMQKWKNRSSSFKTIIHQVRIIDSDSLLRGANVQNTDNKPLTINHENNGLRFSFAAVYYQNSDKIEYSIKLSGLRDSWSSWTSETSRDFTNLREGQYTFHVKARNAQLEEGEPVEFKFVILPPYYRTIYAYAFYFVLALFIVWLLIKLNSKRLERANRQLEKAVVERTYKINQQNEELLAQATQLAQTNAKLEKLSIVARKTDNSVIIFDENLDIEWVNAGFARLYGYNLADFKTKFGNTIYDMCKNPEIRKDIDKSVKSCNPIVYQTKFTKKNDSKIWIQTTLTPIVGKDQNIRKFVAIDSDISKIKLAEREIRIQSEKLRQQAAALNETNVVLEERQEEIQHQATMLAETNELLEYKKSLVERQNEHIHSSIRYAKTIQQAILPSHSLMKQFMDYFIIYRPKDIVSGDFFWQAHLPAKDQFTEKFFFAVADCTGHGVPGAFMSMISSRLLSEIVYERKIVNPALILEALDEAIRIALKQHETNNKDGLEIMLIRAEKLAKNSYRVLVSDAKRPLVLFSHRTGKIRRYRSHRRAIGGIDYRNIQIEFINQEFTLSSKDTIYLMSDGFVDQHDSTRKKIGTPLLLENLQENADKTLTEQKAILENLLQQHQGNQDQRDDITLAGIKLNF